MGRYQRQFRLLGPNEELENFLHGGDIHRKVLVPQVFFRQIRGLAHFLSVELQLNGKTCNENNKKKKKEEEKKSVLK